MPGEGRSKWIWWITFRRGASDYPGRCVPSWVNYDVVHPERNSALYELPTVRSSSAVSLRTAHERAR